MTRITDMRNGIKSQRSRSPGRSGWLFKSPLAVTYCGAHVFYGPVRQHTVNSVKDITDR